MRQYMRSPNQKRYQRGRHSGNNRNNNSGRQYNRNTSFESNGPNVRLRGTAQQLAEKYQQHARDAGANGDYVLRENYLQHAEHYYRIYEPLEAAQNQAAQNAQGADGEPNEMADGDSSQENNDGLYAGQANTTRTRRRRWEMNGDDRGDNRGANRDNNRDTNRDANRDTNRDNRQQRTQNTDSPENDMPASDSDADTDPFNGDKPAFMNLDDK